MRRIGKRRSPAAPVRSQGSPTRLTRTRAPAPVRPGDQLRGWLTTGFARVLEVVDTDLLMWSAARPLRQPALHVPLEIREITTATQLRETVPKERWHRSRPFLRRGDTGYVATVGGEFVGEVWLSRTTHRDPWSGLWVRLAPDEAYAYSLWVAEEYRPHGVSRALMVRMLQAARDDPALTRVYGWVDKRNRESQALLRLLGFTDVQTCKRIHLLHRRGRMVPRSDKPPWGPLSARGRHSGAQQPG